MRPYKWSTLEEAASWLSRELHLNPVLVGRDVLELGVSDKIRLHVDLPEGVIPSPENGSFGLQVHYLDGVVGLPSLDCHLLAAKVTTAEHPNDPTKEIRLGTPVTVVSAMLRVSRSELVRVAGEVKSGARDVAEQARASEKLPDAEAEQPKIEAWIQVAREYAADIWLRELGNNKRPTKGNIAREIAGRLYRDGYVTKRGGRIEDQYILRFALSPKENGGWKPPSPE